MARGVNKVIIIGNLGADPETRFTPNGAGITNITVATSEGWRDKNSGEMQERTEWHRIVLFNRLGEIAAQYLKKGSKVYIEGSIRTNKWQDKDGKDRYTTEIIANNLQMLDSRGGAGGSNEQFNQSRPAAKPQPAAAASSNQAPPAADNFDDDIPF